MDAVATLLRLFDDALSDPYESLEDACLDLTADESAWQPTAYAAEPHDEGVGVPGTILWHLNHLEMCHRHYVGVLDALDPEAPPPETRPPGELPLDAARAALQVANQALRGKIAALSPADLARKARPDRDVAGFVVMIARHVTWHAAMIRQIRRLHRERGAGAR